MNEAQKKSSGHRLNKEYYKSRSISIMFRKYLKTQGGNTKEEEPAGTIGRPPPCPLMAPMFGVCPPRAPSLLGQKLLPVLRCDNTRLDSWDGKSSGAQLTIFYAGTINVYDNVTVDKVQTLLHFASGSSSEALKVLKKDPMLSPSQPFRLPSLCKLQADFPIARKSSLQRFLEKRRDRIISRSPYASSTSTKCKGNEQNMKEELKEDHCFSPSPFPL